MRAASLLQNHLSSQTKDGIIIIEVVNEAAELLHHARVE
jgi:hypothetical protein